jgi:hypothetical protein
VARASRTARSMAQGPAMGRPSSAVTMVSPLPRATAAIAPGRVRSGSGWVSCWCPTSVASSSRSNRCVANGRRRTPMDVAKRSAKRNSGHGRTTPDSSSWQSTVRDP